MAKSEPIIDVLVLGGHPAGYLVAGLLANKTKFRVAHACIGVEKEPDRLVLINPALWSLHPLLKSVEKQIEGKGVYGIRFLSDEAQTASEHRSKAQVGCVASLKDVRAAFERMAAAEKVEFIKPKQLRIVGADEKCVEVSLGGSTIRPTSLVLAGRLDAGQEKILGLPEDWEPGIVKRYTFARLKNAKAAELGARPLVPMSLDLMGKLAWGWLLPGEKGMQLAVEQDVVLARTVKPVELLRHWAGVLHRHGVLKEAIALDEGSIETVDLPFGGALAHEGVGNRTLLVGPAGGFYSASGEDVYPNCWSALFAAEVLKKALKEPHLQDALQPYRQRWRTTLGEYLRGPQQNLRFLLPLIYRNEVMTSRLAEAILAGKSMVR